MYGSIFLTFFLWKCSFLFYFTSFCCFSLFSTFDKVGDLIYQCLTMPYVVLPLSSFLTQPYLILTLSFTLPYHTIKHYTIPYHTIPYHTIPYHTIPSHIISYHTIPYHTIPPHTIFYFTIPNPILHCPLLSITSDLILLCFT